ncbi:MAG TPA: tRNA (adenosine(37)-N6)-threonylcarbamoyltransferase complex dimerization subunit type 1 TsaB [Acidobacteriaceae bacterium]|nr:tRNA (adenosine(37)-N6)-threonylcarbamoyltransferase complex dimerization subunit type 1 TsaB [Acidobacteriaceae bacterium]
MMALAIDTCGPNGSIALGRVESNTVDVLARTELAAKTYSAQLIPALRSMLQQQGMEASALQAIVVVNGPGSFTGVRIGLSSAKGLADALEIPLLAVSRLAVLAWRAESSCAALDAGRGEFYFRDGDREFLLGAKDLPLMNSESVAVCEGSAQQAFAGAIVVDPPAAEDALRYAVSRLLAHDFADVETLDGNYVRRSDAEIFAKTAGKA